MSDKTFIDPSRICVWLHTWHGRDEGRGATMESVAASDVGDRMEVMRQPTGCHRDDFYMQTLHDLAHRDDIDWMLRLEDDVLVNRHLLHNVCRWNAVHHPLFGAGWLSVTGGIVADRRNCKRRGPHLTREYHGCFFAGGVLVRTSFLRSALPVIDSRLRELGRKGGPLGSFAPGSSVAYAAWESGKRVFFHYKPSLVFIDMTVPNWANNRKSHVAQPFSETWRSQ